MERWGPCRILDRREWDWTRWRRSVMADRAGDWSIPLTLFPNRGTFGREGYPMPKTKTETIRARVDARLKADAEAVLDKLGLTASEAIRLFYRQVALRKGLPFDVKLPNAETRRAMKELDEGKDVTRYDDFDDFRRTMIGG
jgi:DNA-damage-inducible protein J